MATFSQQFLSSLANPTGMLQGAANLGKAFGSVPGQMKEKRILGEQSEELKNSGLKPNSSGYLAMQARQASERGDRDLAIKYSTAAAQAKNTEETLRLAQVKAKRDKVVAGQQDRLYSQGQEKIQTTKEINEQKSNLLISDLKQSLESKTNFAGESLSPFELDKVRSILGATVNLKENSFQMQDRVDKLLGKKEVVNTQLINFVDKNGNIKDSVLASDTKGIDEALKKGWVEGNRVSPPKSGVEIIINPDGSQTIRMGGSKRTAGSETRDDALSQQNELMGNYATRLTESINALKNPERAFGVQGATIDSDTVGQLMQFGIGEFTIETVSSLIGKPITQEEFTKIKSVRAEVDNLASNARSVTKGIQTNRSASVAEKELADKLIKGIKASETLEDVLASLELFQDILVLRQASIGRRQASGEDTEGQKSLKQMSDEDLLKEISRQ